MRPVSPADESYLLALRQRTMDEHFARLDEVPTKDAHLERLRDHYGDIRVIHVDDRPVGMVKAYRGEAEWVLSQVQIAPEHQGKGLGEQVVRLLLADAKRDAVPVTLRVLTGNPARRLYERLGFVEFEGSDRGATLIWRP